MCLFYTIKCSACMYAYVPNVTLISQSMENSVLSFETNIVSHHICVEDLTRSSTIEEIAHNCWDISSVPDVITFTMNIIMWGQQNKNNNSIIMTSVNIIWKELRPRISSLGNNFSDMWVDIMGANNLKRFERKRESLGL